jgi:hypothetical protein
MVGQGCPQGCLGLASPGGLVVLVEGVVDIGKHRSRSWFSVVVLDGITVGASSSPAIWRPTDLRCAAPFISDRRSRAAL